MRLTVHLVSFASFSDRQLYTSVLYMQGVENELIKHEDDLKAYFTINTLDIKRNLLFRRSGLAKSLSTLSPRAAKAAFDGAIKVKGPSAK